MPGENDEYSWWWVVKLNDGRVAALRGSCDYTGWDCQSSLNVLKVADDFMALADAFPEKEEYSTRTIAKNIAAQLAGTQPFAMYQE